MCVKPLKQCFNDAAVTRAINRLRFLLKHPEVIMLHYSPNGILALGEIPMRVK